MEWLALVVSVLAVSVALASWAGRRLPEVHRFRLVRLYSANPQQVWDGLNALERDKRLADMVVETLEAEPPRRMVRRLADARGPFTGSWEIVLEPLGDGTQLTLVETGTIANPLARLLAKHVLGEDALAKAVLDRLGADFSARRG